MKKRILSIVLFLVLLSLTGCQTSPATAAPAEAVQPVIAESALPEETEAPAEVVLTLTGLNGETRDFSMDELKKLPAAEGQAGIKSSTGKITPPTLFKGILLTDLIKEIGAPEGSFGIEIEAKDGYAMTFSSDQAAGGDFIAYDPATGDETQNVGKLQAIIAYEMDGKPLDLERDGYLRLVVISDENNQVTDGHWSIKWVRKISVKEMAVEWNLALEGGIIDAVDRGSFESCSTAKCHASEWKDDEGRTWSGTPLWLFAGRADDEIKHGDGSFNLALYDKGYTVEVVAKDGYSAIFEIERLIANKDIILANQVDGEFLKEDDFPLRLVGSDLNKKESAGGIEKIILHFGEQAPQETPEAAAALVEASAAPAELPEGKALMVAGLVDDWQAWSMEEMKQMEVVKLTVEHPKKGQQDVEGIRLSELFDLAGVKADAAKVTFTAGDGFTASTDLKTILDCKDCLVAFEADSDSLKLAMPGLESGLWVKELVSITLE